MQRARLISKVTQSGSQFIFFNRMPDLKLLVVSGPSGSGKSTLLRKLLKEYPHRCGFSVSHTTRSPRPGETDGKDYYFCEREEMRKAIDNGDFLEYAEYSRNLYGTSKQAVRDITDQGKICILDVDRQGVLNVKETDIDCHFLFVKAPSMIELERRLRHRGSDTEEAVQRRLNIAKADMEYAERPDSYDSVVLNDDLEQAYIRFKEIINKEICPLD